MTEATTPIRTDVPLDFHPDILRSLHGDQLIGGDGPGIMAIGTRALDSLYSTYGAIQDARKAAVAAAPTGSLDAMGRALGNVRASRNGGMEIAPEKEVELAAAMTKAFDRVTPQLSTAITALQARKEKIEKAVATAIETPSEKARQLAPQIRGHVKGLPAAERFTFVSKQIKAGDQLTVSAVFGAPNYLSGLTPEAYALARVAAFKQFKPTEYDQIVACEKMGAHLDRAATSFTQSFAKMLPRVTKKVAAGDAIAALAAG